MTRIHQIQCPRKKCGKYQEVKEGTHRVTCRFCGKDYRIEISVDCMTGDSNRWVREIDE